LIENVNSQTAILQQQAMDDDGEGYPQPRNNHQAASNTGRMANRSNGSGQLGATKRSSFAFNDRNGVTKKVKSDTGLLTKLSKPSVDPVHRCLTFEHVIWQVTKEFLSASSLKKPFKTPFKVPFKSALQDLVPKERQPEAVSETANNDSVVAGVADQNIRTYNQTEQILEENPHPFHSCWFLINCPIS
jgi:hypothetical protein